MIESEPKPESKTTIFAKIYSSSIRIC